MDNTKKEARGFFIFFNDAGLVARLKIEELGWLFDSLLKYAQDGTTPLYPNGDRYLQYVFDTFKRRIDSYYKKQGLTRPEKRYEEEPIDKELVYKEFDVTRHPVQGKPFTLEVYGEAL